MFKKLGGLICVYKPPDTDISEILGNLKYAIVKGINELPCRAVGKMVKINEENNQPSIVNNLADSVEALGPRYIR